MPHLRRVYVLGVILAGGCSGATSEPAAEAPPAAEAVVAAADDVDGSAASPADERVDLTRRLAQLTRQAEEHQRRGYFEQSLAARAELVGLLEGNFGFDSWQARSARLALAHEHRRHEFSAPERAVCDAAEAREREARQLWNQNRPQEAAAALAEAQRLGGQVWGEASYGVASLADQGARWRLAVGDQAGAEELFRQALAIRQSVFTADHPDTVASRSSLGLILQARGRNDQAEPLLREAAERAETVWGAQHVEYALHLNNLAMLLHEQEKNAEASDLLTRALDIRRQAAGERHEVVGHTHLNLGSVYYAERQYGKATASFREALAIFEPALGGGHGATRKARTSLALTRMAERDFREAELLLREDLAVTRRDLGEINAEYAEDLARLAALYGNEGRFDQALPLAEQSAAIHAKAGGPADPRGRQSQELVAKVRERIAARSPAGQDRATRTSFEQDAAPTRR